MFAIIMKDSKQKIISIEMWEVKDLTVQWISERYYENFLLIFKIIYPEEFIFKV